MKQGFSHAVEKKMSKIKERNKTLTDTPKRLQLIEEIIKNVEPYLMFGQNDRLTELLKRKSTNNLTSLAHKSMHLIVHEHTRFFAHEVANQFPRFIECYRPLVRSE